MPVADGGSSQRALTAQNSTAATTAIAVADLRGLLQSLVDLIQLLFRVLVSMGELSSPAKRHSPTDSHASVS